MDTERVQALLAEQDGVVARRQVATLGGTRADVERMLRRRAWVRLLPGVYVDHTGRPTWQQRSWAGVLHAWPAALSHASALRAVAGPGWRRYDDDGPIDLAIPWERRLVAPRGYRVHRVRGLDQRVQWLAGPPRVRVEEAALDVAAAAVTPFGAIAVLADLCQLRRTTPERLATCLDARSRIRGRGWLGEVLDDLVAGTCSVLEHAYLTRVERAHGLPHGRRQHRVVTAGVVTYRDVDYDDLGLVVELDGRLFHDSATRRDHDLDRDLDAAVAGRTSVRLSWGQVLERPCRTAGRISDLLQARGWAGAPVRCGPDCRLPASSGNLRLAR
jgi:hypothetical protein